MSAEQYEASTKIGTVALILMGCVVTFLVYRVFFCFSAEIWDCYSRIDPGVLTPSIRLWVNEHDGIEAYVLYVFSFISMGLTALLSTYPNEYARCSPLTVHYFRLLIGLVGTVFLLEAVGFYPPMPAIANGVHLILSCGIVFAWCFVLMRSSRLPNTLSYPIVLILLLPLCFIATCGISLLDYAFIFSPAYRLIHSTRLEHIYIQYDLLMAVLAALWMKLGLALNDFQIIPRVSTYLFLFTVFVYAKRMFTKPLAGLLLVSLIVIKIYAAPNNDLAASIQLTPLRLDLWLVPLWIASDKGLYSKWLGLALGLMYLLHHNFGLFYLLSYVEVLIVLLVLDYVDLAKKTRRFVHAFALAKTHLRLVFPNVVLISMGVVLYSFLFRNSVSESVVLYKTLGIGFLRVSTTSFYWYVLLLISLVFTLLMQQRKALSATYFSSGVFLVFLVVANSLYFFGRSHEWNILSISGVLVLAFFLFVDLMNKKYTHLSGLGYRFTRGLPYAFLCLITYYYSERIATHAMTQVKNILHAQLEYPMLAQAENKGTEELEKKAFRIEALKSLTQNSQKVYVLSYLYDFYYYYYGDYKPRGHFSPYYAWPIKAELVRYLQNLLDKGFYLVIPLGKVLSSKEVLADWEIEGHREILNALIYKHEVKKNGFNVVWK